MSDVNDRRQHLRERGVFLATLGLLLGVALAFTLQAVQDGRLVLSDVVRATAGVLVLQAFSWGFLRSGLADRVAWDRHFVLIPVLLATVAVNYLFYFTPAAMPLFFVAWVVSMLFIAGLAGFSAVFGMATVMTAGYLLVSFLLVERGAPISLQYNAVLAGSFLALGAYTGLIFERLRRDRVERRQLRQQLSQLAFTDPLTDLPNRRHFEQVIDAEIARIDRYGGVCSLAILDVDHFKNYNDTLGHPAGDEVLRRLSSLMRDHLRATDFLARYGGEEFALLMVNTPRKEAILAVQRILDAVEQYPFPDEHVQPRGHITVSAGVAAAPEEGSEPSTIIHAADVALYKAKRDGRNRIVA